MARRVERMMLGTPLLPRTIAAVKVVSSRENPVATGWMLQFAPMLRYANPSLVCEFRVARRAEVIETLVSEASPTATSAVAPDVPSEAEHESEHIEIEFTDGTQHLMNLLLYRQPHQVMQRILDIDTEKSMSAG
eukprot:TRINITY_DN60230_c0_g1_i1.p1 TRINITY_DN60230_c0_g1~~TRINITY_DN60230_c0_g1_i1.p1  ORF type:complete len:134 (+),score=18.74 TRINITY_DN60230_c0_g1_i1:65-466(+)